MEKALSGKTALVTGASRGIGAAAAVKLAEAGVTRLLLHYGSYQEGMDNTLAAVRDLGARADAVQADLRTAAGIDVMVEAVKARGEAFDILINNAGSLVKRARLEEFTPGLFDEVMNLNVKSVWFLTQAVVPAMTARGSGVIVNLSSIAARNGGGIGAGIYAAAKASVSAITKNLAKELAPRGIRVNAVSPGTVDNYFHEQFSTRQMLDAVVAQTPAGRLATNEETADVILYLCSPGSGYVHGQTIEVNGGMWMV
ncbi:MAG: SDR family oxidoreductase [Bryobacterales bacterium]|jgi:3-oxoacyl-[acyl-carrier protein] reductase|nr:SDR family oxidoreductase [Bryobacterales bacterium]